MNTNMKKETTLPQLADETVAQLKKLRAQDDKQPFYALIVGLRRNKWPLRAIATPLGVSRSIVNIWESKLNEGTPVPEAEDLPNVISEQVRPIYMRYTLTEEESIELYVLAREASKVRRFTDPDSPSREAARKLEEKLHYHKERGASLNTLKVACGVTRRAIAQRLEKREKENAVA